MEKPNEQQAGEKHLRHGEARQSMTAYPASLWKKGELEQMKTKAERFQPPEQKHHREPQAAGTSREAARAAWLSAQRFLGASVVCPLACHLLPHPMPIVLRKHWLAVLHERSARGCAVPPPSHAGLPGHTHHQRIYQHWSYPARRLSWKMDRSSGIAPSGRAQFSPSSPFAGTRPPVPFSMPPRFVLQQLPPPTLHPTPPERLGASRSFTGT